MLPANNLHIFTANYSALTNNGADPRTLDSPFSIGSNSYTHRSWLAQRWNKLTNDLASVAASFEISNNGGNNFAVTNQTSITLFGKAPVEVAYIRTNGATSSASVTWTSVTNWSVGVALSTAPSTNTIIIRGFDRLNQLLATNLYQKSIIITNK